MNELKIFFSDRGMLKNVIDGWPELSSVEGIIVSQDPANDMYGVATDSLKRPISEVVEIVKIAIFEILADLHIEVIGARYEWMAASLYWIENGAPNNHLHPHLVARILQIETAPN